MAGGAYNALKRKKNKLYKDSKLAHPQRWGASIITARDSLSVYEGRRIELFKEVEEQREGHQRTGTATWQNERRQIGNRFFIPRLLYEDAGRETHKERQREMSQRVWTSMTVILLISPSIPFSPQALGLCTNQGGCLEEECLAEMKRKVLCSPVDRRRNSLSSDHEQDKNNGHITRYIPIYGHTGGFFFFFECVCVFKFSPVHSVDICPVCVLSSIWSHHLRVKGY